MKFRLALNKYKIPGAVFFSKYGMIPDRNVDIAIVTGKSIQLPKIASPTQKDIDHYHVIYL